jgi:YD repeat-containing protein
MTLRGNLRELLKRLRRVLKPDALVPVIFLLVFFLAAGFFAITQETGDEEKPEEFDLEGGFPLPEEGEDGFEPEFIPAGPPRWFRSNAGGMALEEIPSRLGAIRNKYALVIDYAAPDELDPRLEPFFRDEYIIEIRILYKDKKEIRKQWLLRDEAGNTRVNAVFRAAEDEDAPVADGAVPEEQGGEPEPEAPALAEAGEPELALADTETPSAEDAVSEAPSVEAPSAETPSGEAPSGETASEEIASGEVQEPGAEASNAQAPNAQATETRTPAGFIEVYDENGRIARDYSLFEDGGEILIEYVYNGSALIRAETKTKDPDGVEYRKTHTDNYRYNRSYSLRNVERVFHEAAGVEPVRLVFPGRVLDAAYEKDFIKEKTTLASDFMGGDQVDDGYRMVYDTDSRGRVMGETLYDAKGEVVWKVINTWIGDRIKSILKIEGEDEKLTEYDYDGSGNRIAQRDIQNGVLERQVLIDGSKETEELYMNGVVVLRAFWEDGRKISEERVRRR